MYVLFPENISLFPLISWFVLYLILQAFTNQNTTVNNKARPKLKNRILELTIWVTFTSADEIVNGKRFQYLTTLHVKLFLLRVLPVWRTIQNDDRLFPGFLENLNRSILWYRKIFHQPCCCSFVFSRYWMSRQREIL